MNRYIQDPGYWANRELNTQERMTEVLAQRLDNIGFQLMCIEVTLAVLLVCLIFVIGVKKQ